MSSKPLGVQLVDDRGRRCREVSQKDAGCLTVLVILLRVQTDIGLVTEAGVWETYSGLIGHAAHT